MTRTRNDALVIHSVQEKVCKELEDRASPEVLQKTTSVAISICKNGGDVSKIPLSTFVDVVAKATNLSARDMRTRFLSALPTLLTPNHYTLVSPSALKHNADGSVSPKSRTKGILITPEGVHQLLCLGSEPPFVLFKDVVLCLLSHYRNFEIAVQQVSELKNRRTEQHREVRAQRQDAIAECGAGYSREYGLGTYLDLVILKTMVEPDFKSPKEAVRSVVPASLLPSKDKNLRPMDHLNAVGHLAAGIHTWNQAERIRGITPELSTIQTQTAKRRRVLQEMHDLAEDFAENPLMPRGAVVCFDPSLAVAQVAADVARVPIAAALTCSQDESD